MDTRDIDPISKLNEALRSKDNRYLPDILSKMARQGAAGRRPTFGRVDKNTWFDFDFPSEQAEKKLQAILEYYNKLPGNKTISIKEGRIYFNNMFLYYVVAAIIKMWDGANSSLRITEQDDNITKNLTIPIIQLRQSAASAIIDLAGMGLTHDAVASALHRKFIQGLDLNKHNSSQVITDETGSYKIEAYSGNSHYAKINNLEIIPSDPILSRYFSQLDKLQCWHFLIEKNNKIIRISGFYLILFYLYGHSPFISAQNIPVDYNIPEIIEFLNIPKPNKPIPINQQITSPFQIPLLEYLKLSVLGKPTYDNRHYSQIHTVWNIFKELEVIMIDSYTLRVYLNPDSKYKRSFSGRFYSLFEKDIQHLFNTAGIVIRQVDISQLSIDIALHVAEQLKENGVSSFNTVLSEHSDSSGHIASANSGTALPSRQMTVGEKLEMIAAERDIHQRLMLAFSLALGVNLDEIRYGRRAEDWLLEHIGIKPWLYDEPSFRTIRIVDEKYETFFELHLTLNQREVLVDEYSKIGMPFGFGDNAVTLAASTPLIYFNTYFLIALLQQVLIEQHKKQELIEQKKKPKLNGQKKSNENKMLSIFSNTDTSSANTEIQKYFESLFNIEPVRKKINDISAQKDLHEQLIRAFAYAFLVDDVENIRNGRLVPDFLLSRVPITPNSIENPVFKPHDDKTTSFKFNMQVPELRLIVDAYNKVLEREKFENNLVTLNESEGVIYFPTSFLISLAAELIFKKNGLSSRSIFGADYSEVYEKFAKALGIDQSTNPSYLDQENNKLIANTLTYLAGQVPGGPNARLLRLPGNRCLLCFDPTDLAAPEATKRVVGFYKKMAGEPLSENSPTKSKAVSIVLKRDSKLKSMLSTIINDANFFDNSRDHYLILFNNDFLVNTVSRLMNAYVEINKSISSSAHRDSDSYPNGMLCPLSLAIMKDPLICTLDGTIYERDFITEWLSKSRRSPINRQEMGTDQVVADVLVECKWLKDLIEKYLTQHPERRP